MINFKIIKIIFKIKIKVVSVKIGSDSERRSDLNIIYGVVNIEKFGRYNDLGMIRRWDPI